MCSLFAISNTLIHKALGLVFTFDKDFVHCFKLSEEKEGGAEKQITHSPQMKTLTFTLLFAFLGSFGFTQTARNQLLIDSLKRQLTIAKHDTSRVLILVQLSYRHRNSKLDSALVLGQQALKLARQINYPKGEVLAAAETGRVLLDLGNLPQALEMLFKALQIAENNHLSAEIAPPLNYIGNVYFALGNYPKALNYLRQSLDIAKAKHDSRQVLIQKMNIGLVFEKMNQLDSALYYEQQAYEGMYRAGTGINPITFRNLGNIQAKLSNNRLAMDYYKKSLQVNQAGGKGIIDMVVMNLIAKLYQKEEINLQRDKAEKALTELKTTQAQLIQKEKLASLGELTAGIAHEIQNPLNFVNNFSELSVELAKELKGERLKGKEERDEELENELVDDLIQNQEKHHGKRASSIVKGILEHSRTATGERQLTDINQLADEYLRLSYHGLRAKNNDFNSDYELITDENLPKIEVVAQEIGRVLLNLINNAFYAVNTRAKQGEPNYQPKVTVSTKLVVPPLERSDDSVRGLAVIVSDNGTGIPDGIKSKIFQPFFTRVGGPNQTHRRRHGLGSDGRCR